jgi:hypothetical protein
MDMIVQKGPMEGHVSKFDKKPRRRAVDVDLTLACFGAE